MGRSGPQEDVALVERPGLCRGALAQFAPDGRGGEERRGLSEPLGRLRGAPLERHEGAQEVHLGVGGAGGQHGVPHPGGPAEHRGGGGGARAAAPAQDSGRRWFRGRLGARIASKAWQKPWKIKGKRGKTRGNPTEIPRFEPQATALPARDAAERAQGGRARAGRRARGAVGVQQPLLRLFPGHTEPFT